MSSVGFVAERSAVLLGSTVFRVATRLTIVVWTDSSLQSDMAVTPEKVTNEIGSASQGNSRVARSALNPNQLTLYGRSIYAGAGFPINQ